MTCSIDSRELATLLERSRRWDRQLAMLAEFVRETGLSLDELASLDLSALRRNGRSHERSTRGFRDAGLSDRAWLLLLSLALPTTRRALAKYRSRWRRLGRRNVETELHDIALCSLYRILDGLGWR